ncbi:MAG: OmpH family outer membrane protein [Rhodospirillales bacterium]|jgi:outer membrane protein|nr:hypothetical protein [Rhodospirillaceae bacterium]MDP6430624.1 OmpH family outer membrane protein [Rhodospirillales bacterium]MDP6645639.1 OmpH family outer membrane protein [Rhodospirillales bacterium]|tara:strand:- start:2302 stop:2877 length:576 start_codon:yes stop_codon:yes gene_type:complete
MSSPKFAALVFSIYLITNLFVAAAYSQENVIQFKLGVVDIVRLTQSSLLSKDIARQKDGRRKEFRTEIKSEESELRKLKEELQKQRVILSPAAFEQEVKNFRQREIGLQKKVQQRNQEFNRLRVFTNRVFIQELNRALADVTKKHNFTLILRKSGVLVHADVFDITSLVLAQINKNAPNFKIPDVLPKPEK